MAANTRTEVLRKLKANEKARAKLKAEEARLFDERDKLYLEARSADPAITVREIAELSGVTEVAVNKRLAQLRKAS